MLSLNSNLSFSNSSVMHSFVDSFFEGKKALVKERLMESVKVVVDGLFEEMVGQVKEMLLPPKSADNDQVKAYAVSTPTPAKPSTSLPPMKTVPPSQPPKNKLIFATKSKPGPSTSAAAPQPFSGLYKRMAEEDGVSTSSSNCQAKKKKGVTVELQIDGPLDDEDDYGDVALDDGAGEQLDKGTAQGNTVIGSKTVACPEPGCGKLIAGGKLKRHMRTHTNSKPFGCNYSGCSLEFTQRGSAIRHILNVHLKKQKPEGGNEVADDPPDPSTYLTVKEELL